MIKFHCTFNLYTVWYTTNIHHLIKISIIVKLRFHKWNNVINQMLSLRSEYDLHCLGLRPVPCAGLPMTWLKSFGILSLSLISFSALNRASRSNILLSNEVLDILYQPVQTAYSNTTELWQCYSLSVLLKVSPKNNRKSSRLYQGSRTTRHRNTIFYYYKNGEPG